MTERALACTELTSKGTCEKTITVCNFNDYKVKNQPSGSIGNDTIAAMQHNYPERLNSYIVTWVGGGGFAKNIARLVWGKSIKTSDFIFHSNSFIFQTYKCYLHHCVPSCNQEIFRCQNKGKDSFLFRCGKWYPDTHPNYMNFINMFFSKDLTLCVFP